MGSEPRERVNVFVVDDQYLFKHYFDESVFDLLRAYYNNSQYRFEVTPERFGDLQPDLEEAGYTVEIIEETAPYVVAVEMYTGHPENIFQDAVATRRSDGHNCFLLTNQYAVARVVSQGADRLTDTDIENPF